MRILLYQDATTELDERAIGDVFARHAPHLGVQWGSRRFELPTRFVSTRFSYDDIPAHVREEVRDADLSMFFTAKQYDNNFFWDIRDNMAIASVYGWSFLTDVAPSVGAAYFVVNGLFELLDVGYEHDESTGCISDVLWDKRGIDGGMRAAYLCRDCRSSLDRLNAEQVRVVDEALKVLAIVSTAARSGIDLAQVPGAGDQFDTFLCHNSNDKPAVRSLARSLRDHGVRYWLDVEHLQPGVAWQAELERMVGRVRSVVVCVGKSGLGPWQNTEVTAFLEEAVHRGCRVIPTILEDCPDVPALPLFLRSYTWVDFREADPDPLARLIWGITDRRMPRRNQ